MSGQVVKLIHIIPSDMLLLYTKGCDNSVHLLITVHIPD